LSNTSPLACGFHFIPYKTHDEKGMSNLFDVTCATYQALVDEVSIINDSWGFYGTGSIILQNAINRAKVEKVLIVSAAGNDSISLDNNLLYPACYLATNQLSVGSYDTNGEGSLTGHSIFSNFSNTWVDISAEGRDVESAVPSWYPISGIVPSPCYDNITQRDCKTGTSMATPTVTAAAAVAYCERPEDYLYAIERVLGCADDYDVLQPFVNGGLALNSRLDEVCLTPLDPEPTLPTDQVLTLYPNPAQAVVTLSSRATLTNGTLRLYSATGRLVQEYPFDSWQAGEEQQLELAQLPTGLYLVQLQTKQELYTLKLVKN
jgi:subtilisin family serine protease